jgi:hypothetical protein
MEDTPASASSEPRLLGRDDILSVADRQYDAVAVPEWGGHVRLQSLTGDERDQYEDSTWRSFRNRDGSVTREQTMQKARAKMVAMCAVDANGARLFTQGDVELLGKKSTVALQRLFLAAITLSSISEKEVEELGEGSAADRGGDSPSV